MSQLCRANPCCGEFYGGCKVPMPQDVSGFWNRNSEDEKQQVLREREANERKNSND